MQRRSPFFDVMEGIRDFAEAHHRFHLLQQEHPALLPVGDQKTGVIGEFFAMAFAQATYPDASVRYSENPSETVWDLEVIHPSSPRQLIQVKTVSTYATRRKISPLSRGWDHLYLLFLDKDLLPTGFWVVSDAAFMGGREEYTGLKMRDPYRPNTGSECIPWGDNQAAALRKILGV